MVILARKINNLQVIFKYNNCGIDKLCAEQLLSFVELLNLNSVKSDFCNIPHHDKFKLLAESLTSITDIENIVMENSYNTAY